MDRNQLKKLAYKQQVDHLAHAQTQRKKMSTKRQKTGRISQRQFKIMLDFMEKNVGISHGKADLISPKRQLKIKWEELANSLNSVSTVNNMGCQKTPDQWRKCWSDKKICIRNKIRMRNPCSECSKEQGLNQLERRILNLFPAYAAKELEDREEDWSTYEFCQCPKNDRSMSPDADDGTKLVLSQPVKDSDGVLFCPVIETQESCSSSSSKDQLILEQQQLNDLLTSSAQKNNQILLYPVLENGSISNIPSCSSSQQLESITNFENIIVLNDVLLAPAATPSNEPVSSSLCVKESTNYNNGSFLFTSDPNRTFNSSNSVSLLRRNTSSSEKAAESEKVSKIDSIFHASVIDEIEKLKNLPISFQSQDVIDRKYDEIIESSKSNGSLINIGSESEISMISPVLNQENFNHTQDALKVKSLTVLTDSNILCPVLQETEISSNTSFSGIPVIIHPENPREFEISPNSNLVNVVTFNSVPPKIRVPNCAFFSKLQNLIDAEDNTMYDDDTVLNDIEASMASEKIKFSHTPLVLDVPPVKSVENKDMNKTSFSDNFFVFKEITTSYKASTLEEDNTKNMLIKEASKGQKKDKKRKLSTEEETDSVKNLIKQQNKMLAIIAEASQKRAEQATQQTDILVQLVQEVKKLSQSVTKLNT